MCCAWRFRVMPNRCAGPTLRDHVLRGEAMNMPLVQCDKCRSYSESDV